MGKDPAFLFYPGDWLGGTQLFTRSQKGAYMDVLMAQYANGHLSIDDIKGVLNGDYDSMWESRLKAKFKIDENGNFYNEKLEKVISERKNFTASRLNNLKGSSDNTPIREPHKKPHTDSRMEDGDLNESSIEDSGLKKSGRSSKPNGIPTERMNDIRDLIHELNSLTGHQYRYTSKNVIKYVNPRLDEYDFHELIDMIRGMVYKWKGNPLMDQYLRPKTLFASENCENYIEEMRLHKENGTKPIKGTEKINSKINKDGIEQAVAALYAKK